MKAYARILGAVYSEVWALQPGKLEAITGFLELKAEGKLPDADVQAEIHAAAELTAARAQKAGAMGSGSVAVLPLYGLIMQRGNMMGDVSGPRGTSVEQFKAQFRQAVNDPAVKAIVIDVDSPGGTVSGVDELASEILAARGKKKVIAVSNCLMASAAYYIASAATEIVASPSSQTGSIGVYAALRDESAALEKSGVKVTLVTYGANKAEGDPRVPITQNAIDGLQKMVDHFGGMFDAAVARGRGVSAARVRDSFGQGLSFSAPDAKAIGMVDRIATLDDVLAELGVGAGSARIQMEADQPEIAAWGLCRAEVMIDATSARCTQPRGHGGAHFDQSTQMHWGVDLAAADAAPDHSALRRKLELASA